MNAETARIALQFLARVDLKGAETPAFMQVIAALDAIANPSLSASPIAKEPSA